MSIFTKIINKLFPKPDAGDKPSNKYKIAGGLGNHISWRDECIGRQIYGHMQIRPRSGERFWVHMQSGKIGMYKLKNVEYCRDPQDMFFADVKFIGYKND